MWFCGWTFVVNNIQTLPSEIEHADIDTTMLYEGEYPFPEACDEGWTHTQGVDKVFKHKLIQYRERDLFSHSRKIQ
jgi:hypothetical protein